MLITDDPIFQSKSMMKNGKRIDLDELSWIFDCPHCEYVFTAFQKEGAVTMMDVHFFNHHPEAHVPLVPADLKEKVWECFQTLRIRTSRAGVAASMIRDPAK